MSYLYDTLLSNPYHSGIIKSRITFHSAEKILLKYIINVLNR
jgi:hypothetical protein